MNSNGRNTAPLKFSTRLASRTRALPRLSVPSSTRYYRNEKEEIDRFPESGSLLGSGRATHSRSSNECFDAERQSCLICQHEYHSGPQGTKDIPQSVA